MRNVISRKGLHNEKKWTWIFLFSLLINFFCDIYYGSHFSSVANIFVLNYIPLLIGIYFLRNYIQTKIASLFPKICQPYKIENANGNKKIDSGIVHTKKSFYNKIPLIGNVVFKLVQSKFFYFYSVTAVVFTGFFIRLLIVIYGGMDLDEGIHLYDAKLITEGLVPFRDYFSREVNFIYVFSFFVKIFGPKLLVSRLISILAASLTATAIYFIGKNLFSKKIGLIGCALFSLSPYVIYNTYLGNLYSLYYLVISLVFLIFILFLKRPTTLIAFFLGLSLGLSVHFYRIAIVYFPIFGFIWGMKLHERRFTYHSFFYFILATAVGIFPPIIYFSQVAGYRNFDILYGTKELVGGFLLIFVSLCVGYVFNVVYSKYSKQRNTFIIVGLILSSIFILFSFFYFGLRTDYKMRVLFSAFVQNWHLIFPILFILLLYIKSVLFKTFQLPSYIKYILFFVLLCSFRYSSIVEPHLQLFGVRVVPFPRKFLALILFIVSLLYLPIFTRLINIRALHFKKDIFCWWLLFFAPAFFYLIHVQWNVANFMSFIVLGSVISAVGYYLFIGLINELHPAVRYSTYFILLLFFISPIQVYTNFPLRDRSLWPQKSRHDVENYLIQNTNFGDEIFTTALVFVLDTGRRSVLDLSRPTIYGTSEVEMPDYIGTTKNLRPSSEVAQYILDHVNVLLIDNRTRSVFNSNAEFAKIKEFYYMDKVWPEYEIEAWKKR